MNFIRKFYNTDVAETAGGSEAPAMSIAEAMAKHGVSNGTADMVATPIDITKKDEAPKVEETTPAETAKVETDTEKPASETSQESKPKEETKPAEPAPIVQKEAEKVTPTWQEVLKKEQPDTILKELGFDDQKAEFVSKLKDADPKLVGIMQAYENGTLGDYIKELSADYSKMTAEDVMRHQLRQEYPKASDKAFEALYEAEVIEKYKLDPDVYTDAEVEKGRLLLEAKADKHRDTLVENQQKFLLPKAPEPKPKVEAEADNTEQLQQQRIETYKEALRSDPYTKDIVTNKKITLGEGDEKFSYKVEANELIEILSDGQKMAETMWDAETGSPKTEHQLLVALVAKDGTKFLNEYAKHYKALGGKAVTDLIDNAKPAEGTTPTKSEANPNSPAAAMAKAGKVNYGGS